MPEACRPSEREPAGAAVQVRVQRAEEQAAASGSAVREQAAEQGSAEQELWCTADQQAVRVNHVKEDDNDEGIHGS